MRIKLIFAFLLIFSGAAFAQYSKTTIASQINTQFPDNSTGAITPATTRAFLNNLLNSYQQFAALNKQVGTTYTIQTSDYGQLVTFNNGSAIAVSLPQAAGSFSTFNFYAQDLGVGTATITPSGGSTICGGSTLALTTNEGVWIISDGTNYQCVFQSPGQFAIPITVAQGGTNCIAASGTCVDNISGFSSTGFLTRTGAGTYVFQSTTNGITLPNIAQLPANTTICNYLTGTNTPVACTGGQISANLCLPSRTVVTTASNVTYSTPTCNGVLPTYIEVEMVGAGGGGAGSGTSPSAAGAGTATCWNASGTACSAPTFQAAGGAAGVTASGGSSAGGAASNCDLGLTGGSGVGSGNGTTQPGGAGGTSYFGGNGPGQAQINAAVAGIAAVANTGSAGGGASSAGTAGAGGGGAAGAYCRKAITGPASSYVYTIGTHGVAGGAGSGGAAGGVGADGLIAITARWQ